MDLMSEFFRGTRFLSSPRDGRTQWPSGGGYVFDSTGGKSYVGSAYGAANILGRWMNYSATGEAIGGATDPALAMSGMGPGCVKTLTLL